MKVCKQPPSFKKILQNLPEYEATSSDECLDKGDHRGLKFQELGYSALFEDYRHGDSRRNLARQDGRKSSLK